MDNLWSHKPVAAITSAGSEVWFLSRCSPDPNPFEKMFSKLMSFLC